MSQFTPAIDIQNRQTLRKEANMGKMLCLHGLSRDVDVLQGKSDDELAQKLVEWGFSGAFVDELDLAPALRRHGLKAFASVRVFEGREEWQNEPSLRAIGEDGRPATDPDEYGSLCPANQALRKRRLERIRELSQDRSLSGIWLDFIRFPCVWDCPRPVLKESCFCPKCLRQFARRFELTYPSRFRDERQRSRWIIARQLRRWTRWKCQQIASFIGEAKRIVKTIRPALLLGAFVVPWRDGDFKDAIQRIIGQDFSAMGTHLDVLSPMTYHRMCNHDVDWIADVAESVARRTARAIWPAIQTWADPEEMPDEEFNAALRAATSGQSQGVILFNFREAAREGRLDVAGRLG